MTRVVKTHDERRGELLDTAQTLFYQKGYESTSVAEVIEAVGIAKGTFYHYFKSKQELLDQIIDRQVEIIDQVVDPIVNDVEMKAIDKFNKLFSSVGQYKAANRDVMVMLVKVLYADENLRLLDRMTKSRIHVAPCTRNLRLGVMILRAHAALPAGRRSAPFAQRALRPLHWMEARPPDPGASGRCQP